MGETSGAAWTRTHEDCSRARRRCRPLRSGPANYEYATLTGCVSMYHPFKRHVCARCALPCAPRKSCRDMSTRLRGPPTHPPALTKRHHGDCMQMPQTSGTGRLSCSGRAFLRCLTPPSLLQTGRPSWRTSRSWCAGGRPPTCFASCPTLKASTPLVPVWTPSFRTSPPASLWLG